MKYLCEYLQSGGVPCGVRIRECRGLDTLAAVPERIGGLPVTELAPYVFSEYGRPTGTAPENAFWWDTDRLPRDEKPQLPGGGAPEKHPPELRPYAEKHEPELPVLRGDRLEELRLPSGLQKVGAYALYNCGKLRRLEIYSTALDWGAGVFTGCYGVEELVIHADEGRKSCMREILSELRQTLRVIYLPEPGYLPETKSVSARLIFPEFFEEAVENTPARILVTETHGCGQRYRNAFVSTQFQFKEYDSLFPHVQVQEPEPLVCRLALDRLMYPYRLEDAGRRCYLEYLAGHAEAAAGQAVVRGDMDELEWLFAHISYGSRQMEKLLELAGGQKDGAAVSFLMDRNRGMGAVKRKHFSL